MRLDAALDSAKRGPLWLANPEFAAYAEYPIVHGAELGRYQLHAYVVMPNHVHILLDPYVPLAKIFRPTEESRGWRHQRQARPHRQASLAGRIV